jgi:hypothetical protein
MSDIRFARREAPPRRPLKIFSSDPMGGRLSGNRITIDVPFEKLAPGPSGRRIEVVDYDGEHDCYYPPVDLNHPAILMQGGLEPSESDPRFHQQMVYAVAMRVIENFERALGRPMNFSYGKPLRLFPHAFYGANAYYDRGLKGIVFGYFRAARNDPGLNLPGQTVFTCLSHDIIAHEMTHAVVDRLRPHFLEASNRDVRAFHEGFADIVALFQHFSFEQSLREHILLGRTDLRKRDLLVTLAQQFGQARGTGKALRSALDDANQSKKLLDTLTQPHRRGSILVAAVFDGFFNIYQRRISDLIRIATNGSGNLPDADPHPDLVNRITAEASATAQSVLTMCIRAFDYLPPVDITFGDYLRALITADYELNPIDTFGQRAAMIDAFRLRGIYPQGVVSLAEESLLWSCPSGLTYVQVPVEKLGDLLMRSVRTFTSSHADDPFALEAAHNPKTLDGSGTTKDTVTGHTAASNSALDAPEESDESDSEDRSEMAQNLQVWATKNAEFLGLFVDPERDPKKRINIAVRGFHWVFRIGRNNQLFIELVAQFVQTHKDKDTAKRLGGYPFRGGTTMVVSADGHVRYVIAKPIRAGNTSQDRLEQQAAFVDTCDLEDPHFAWSDAAFMAKRMENRMKFAAIHEGS